MSAVKSEFETTEKCVDVGMIILVENVRKK